MKRSYIFLIASVLILILSFFLYTSYMQKMQNSLKLEEKRDITEQISAKKSESELLINQLIFRLKNENRELQPKAEKELKEDVSLAYETVHTIYEKYKRTKSTKELKKYIKERLSQLRFENKALLVFIKNYNGDTLLDVDDKSANTQYRDITLESVQKVRKHKEGYIRYDSLSNEKKTLYVKNLDLYDWFIGATVNMQKQKEMLKSNILENIKTTPLNDELFLGVFEEEHPLYLTKKLDIDIKSFPKNGAWHKLKNSYYYLLYDKRFQWYILYGFDAQKMITQINKKYKEEKLMLKKEFLFF